jgi:hypothetical protein
MGYNAWSRHSFNTACTVGDVPFLCSPIYMQRERERGGRARDGDWRRGKTETRKRELVKTGGKAFHTEGF